jgi:hypothetical protein
MFFINGVLKNTIANSYSATFNGNAVYIGSHGASYYYRGYLDDYRVSNIARWTKDFKVPKSPYSADLVIKAREIEKGYVGAARYLPEGYTQLDYIESTGTQYIDTGFKPNQDTKIYMNVTPLNLDSATVGAFFFGSGYPIQ